MKNLIFLALIFANTQAFASWTKIASKSFTMEPPPAVGSIEYKKDYDELLILQNTRDEKDCQLARSQVNPHYQEMFIQSGPLSFAEAQRAKPLVEKVMKLSERIARYFKGRFARPRPFTVDSRINPCAFKPSGNTSYPSSHASSASAAACVLAEIYPHKASEILEYGKYLGDLRVITGVHHPSDVKVAQDFAQELCQVLLEREDFRSELEEL